MLNHVFERISKFSALKNPMAPRICNLNQSNIKFSKFPTRFWEKLVGKNACKKIKT
jgi:hypothetical protein